MNIYLEYADKQVLSERKKEWKGLLKCFSLLDKEERGHIGMQRWAEFLKILRPAAGKAEVKFYFELMDRDRSGELDMFDFLDMREILQLRMHPYHERMLAQHGWQRMGNKILSWRYTESALVRPMRCRALRSGLASLTLPHPRPPRDSHLPRQCSTTSRP